MKYGSLEGSQFLYGVDKYLRQLLFLHHSRESQVWVMDSKI